MIQFELQCHSSEWSHSCRPSTCAGWLQGSEEGLGFNVSRTYIQTPAAKVNCSQCALACRQNPDAPPPLHKVLFIVYSRCINSKRDARPNCTKFNTAHPWVPSNTLTKCEVVQMNGSSEMWRTDKYKYLELWFNASSWINVIISSEQNSILAASFKIIYRSSFSE